MDWEKGYSASYYMAVVDPITWRDISRIEITGGSISRKTEGLLQTADVSCINFPQNTEMYVRIYQDVKQTGDGAHTPLFTGIATSPGRDIKGTWSENKVNCYSVLKVADDIYLPKGWYASTDVPCSSIISTLLEQVPAPMEFEDTATTLQNTIVAESRETRFTMLEKIIEVMNWSIRIEGNGAIFFGEQSNEPVAVFDPFNHDVLEPNIQIDADWYSCPNVFMVNTSTESAVARDEDSESYMSIQNRGREVWAYESGITLNSGESPDEYAQRRLKEEQRKLMTASYDRRFIPGVIPGDVITLHYPEQGLDGNFIVTSQSINLGYCASTAESVIGVG